MKRILSLVLALSMVLSIFSFSSAASLSDIAGKPYEAAVEALVELGVVNGYPDGTFLPNNVVTRAELAKLLVTAYGLTEAAEVASKETPFSDVNGHWAAGYINVSADYKFVNGYPDGTFKPDETVTYAEAVTMCLRVLGYANEIDSKGTWPTNYIAKAKDLDLMKDVEYKNNYNDGATRGNVAILVWNMLRTQMWEVREESEGDGLVSRPNRLMINVKFKDYMYVDEDDEWTLDGITVADDGKVTAALSGLAEEYELKAGDLLRMVKGMKIESLMNTKTKTILSLISVDTIVEGRIDEDGKIDKKSYTGITADQEDDYVVFTVDGKRVVELQVLPEDSFEILTEDDIDEMIDNDKDEEKLYILNGKWISVKDLKEDDVITEVTDYGNNFVDGTFYAVGREQVKGSYDGYITDEDGAYVKVDGDEYPVLDDTEYKEYDEKKEDYKDVTIAAISKKDNKYLDEDVRLILDYLGNVVSVRFGEVNDTASADINWYVQTGNMWSVAGRDGLKYYYTLTDVAGDEDDYTIDSEDASGVQAATDLMQELTNELTREDENSDWYVPEEVLLDLIVPAFMDDDKLKLPDTDAYAEGDYDGTIYITDATDTDAAPEWFAQYLESEEALYDKDTKYLVNLFKVGDSTKVIKLKPVIDDDEVTALNVEITSGADELEGVKSALVVAEVSLNDDNTVKGISKRASYVFVAEDAQSAELHFGKVTRIYNDTSVNRIDIDGTTYKVKSVADAAGTLVKGSYVTWTTDADEKISIKGQLRVADLDDDAFITEVKDEFITVEAADGSVVANEFDFEEKYEDFFPGVDDIDDIKFVLINAKFKEDTNPKEVEFDTYQEFDSFEDVEFAEKDRLQTGTINGDPIVVIVRIKNMKATYRLTDGIVSIVE